MGKYALMVLNALKSALNAFSALCDMVVLQCIFLANPQTLTVAVILSFSPLFFILGINVYLRG